MKHVVDGVTYKSKKVQGCDGCAALEDDELCGRLPCNEGARIFVAARPKVKVDGVTYKAVPEVKDGMCRGCAGRDDALCYVLRASGPKDGDGSDLCMVSPIIWVVKKPKAPKVESPAKAFTPWHVDVDGVRYESRPEHHHNSCEDCAAQEGDALCNKLGECNDPHVVFVKVGPVEPTTVTVNVAFTFDGVSQEKAVEHTEAIIAGNFRDWADIQEWKIESVTGRGETLTSEVPVK